MPNTTQRKYYEIALTGLWGIKQKAQDMWKHVKDLRFRDGSIAEFIENPVKRVLFDIKFVMARVYNTLETLQYDTKRLNLKDASKDPDTVGKSVEPVWDMPRIIARLFHLVLTTRYQVVETERYMEESKEWLTADDWIEASCKLRYTVTSLRDLRYKLKLTYPEGDLVKYAELVWFTNNCDVAITDMDHRIDQVSERIIKEYEVNGLLVNIDDEDRGWLKSMPGNISTLHKGVNLTVQHAKTQTLVGSTGEGPASSHYSACPNDQGAQAPTMRKNARLNMTDQRSAST